MEKFKSGFVSLVGRTNVGKSTLLNALVKEKVAITANKVQTTRTAIKAILNDDNYQIIITDTPGIHKPRTKLGETMINTAFTMFSEVDVIMFLIEATSNEIGRGDRRILDKIKESNKPCILIINKIDFESMCDDEFRNCTIKDLNTNKMMLEFLLKMISQEELIDNFCEAIFDNEDNILEVLKCFDYINEKINLEETGIENQLYYTFIYSYNKEFDIDIKCKSYSIMKILLKTKYYIKMIELMKDNANKCIFEEAREIIKIVLYQNVEENDIKDIKEKLLENNNYNIRKITNRYLNAN